MYCTDMNSLEWDLEVAIILKDSDRLNEINELIKNYSEDEPNLNQRKVNSISNTKKYTKGVNKHLIS